MKKLALAVLMAAAAPGAFADIWLNPGFYSHHFETDKNLNSHNGGFGVEATLTDTYSVTAGVFKNSDYATSHYVGVYAMPFKAGAIKAGVAVGAFNGYPRMHEGGWFPAIIPTMAFEGPRLGLNVSVIPKIGDRVHSALAFQIKYNIAP